MYHIVIFLSLFLQASSYAISTTVTPDVLSRHEDKEKYGCKEYYENKRSNHEENDPYERILGQAPKLKTLDSIRDQFLESILKTRKKVNKYKWDLLDPVEKIKPGVYPILAFALWFTKILNYLDEMMTVRTIKEALENGMKEEFAGSS